MGNHSTIETTKQKSSIYHIVSGISEPPLWETVEKQQKDKDMKKGHTTNTSAPYTLWAQFKTTQIITQLKRQGLTGIVDLCNALDKEIDKMESYIKYLEKLLDMPHRKVNLQSIHEDIDNTRLKIHALTFG